MGWKDFYKKILKMKNNETFEKRYTFSSRKSTHFPSFKLHDSSNQEFPLV